MYTRAMSKPEKLMSPRDVADYLDVPVATIYGWRHKGVGPPGLAVGRHVRYRREAVEAWLERQQVSRT